MNPLRRSVVSKKPFDPKAVAFTPEAVDYFVRLGMLKPVEAEKLQRLTTGELKEMGGRLPAG